MESRALPTHRPTAVAFATAAALVFAAPSTASSSHTPFRGGGLNQDNSIRSGERANAATLAASRRFRVGGAVKAPVKVVDVLDQAAIDAVLQWQFVQTLLNGEPVEIEMNVTINFTLH